MSQPCLRRCLKNMTKFMESDCRDPFYSLWVLPSSAFEYGEGVMKGAGT